MSHTFDRPAKRPRLPDSQVSLAFTNSSDPAVFTSDDDDSFDNYSQGRPKKRYLGSWYQRSRLVDDADDRSTAPARPKRSFARQHDSGVYMTADGLDSDDILPNELPVPHIRTVQVPLLSADELETRHVIQRSVDSCQEIIDLS